VVELTSRERYERSVSVSASGADNHVRRRLIREETTAFRRWKRSGSDWMETTGFSRWSFIEN
jgi:hypothetical protein